MALTDDEIKQLRENLKNPVMVKAMFSELKQAINVGLTKYQSRQPQNETEMMFREIILTELESRSYTFSLLELLFLDQLQIKENIELIADCLSKPDNKELLNKLRTNLESK